MNYNKFAAVLLGVTAAAAFALTSSAFALALPPGHYEIAGIQPICIVNGGTWYGENFPFSGHWMESPNGDTIIFGGDAAIGENDSMITTRRSAQWTEWTNNFSYQDFLSGSVVKLKGPCAAPPARVPKGHSHAMD